MPPTRIDLSQPGLLSSLAFLAFRPQACHKREIQNVFLVKFEIESPLTQDDPTFI